MQIHFCGRIDFSLTILLASDGRACERRTPIYTVSKSAPLISTTSNPSIYSKLCLLLFNNIIIDPATSNDRPVGYCQLFQIPPSDRAGDPILTAIATIVYTAGHEQRRLLQVV